MLFNSKNSALGMGKRVFLLLTVFMASMLVTDNYVFAQNETEGLEITIEAITDNILAEEDKAHEYQVKLEIWEEKQKLKQQEIEKKAKLKEQNKIKKEEYGEYTLGKDDIIDINVRRHPEFSGRFPIGPNGKIQYPFIGDIDLAYLTKTEAIEKITDILSVYITSPEVDITIIGYNSKIVYVLGQVGSPGKYSMRAEFMPVRDAVLAAGLPRENIASLRRALIIRPVEDKKPVVKRVNLLGLLYHGNLKINYDLKSGDIVYLPSTVLFKVSTILSQVLDPAFKAASVHEEVKDIKDD